MEDGGCQLPALVVELWILFVWMSGAFSSLAQHLQLFLSFCVSSVHRLIMFVRSPYYDGVLSYPPLSKHPTT